MAMEFLEDVGQHMPGVLGGSAVTAVVSSLVWGYILRRREDRKDRQQEIDAEIAVAKEWQNYAAEIKQDLDRHRVYTQEALAARDEAISELKRRNDRCEDREHRLRKRVAILEQRLGIQVERQSDDDTPIHRDEETQ